MIVFFQGKITRFLDKGLIVEIALGICGFVPMMHMADVTISNPKKKFSEGQLVKCKVCHDTAGLLLLPPYYPLGVLSDCFAIINTIGLQIFN